MELIGAIIISVITSVGASSGFWAYFTKRSERKSASTKLLLGLAQDRIIYKGLKYIHRGWISKDEYDDLVKYLYGPYKECGGNGLVDRVIGQIKGLPFKHEGPQTKDVYED